MILAKVLSRVVATHHSERIPSVSLLSVEPLPEFGSGGSLIALDTVQAGPGDLVVVLQEGTGARQVVYPDQTDSPPLPAQAVIVGIVDEVYRENV